MGKSIKNNAFFIKNHLKTKILKILKVCTYLGTMIGMGKTLLVHSNSLL
jgi:hypothetical protein